MSEVPATERQLEYIKGLVKARDISSLPEAQRNFLSVTGDELDANLSKLTKRTASNAIKALLPCPKKVEQPERVIEVPMPAVVPVPETTRPEKDYEINRVTSMREDGTTYHHPPKDDSPQPTTEQPVVGLEKEARCPEGYFFVLDPDDGKEKFYRVRWGKEDSRWKGYTFLDVQASDFFYPIKNNIYKDRIFAEILKDPVQAMNQYGMRLGRCGVCNRTLTDRDSRLRGIGPICAERLYGKPSEDELNVLKHLGLV